MLFQNISEKNKLKKNKQFSLEHQKMQPPRHIAQLPIWKGRPGILDIDVQ